MNLDKAINVIYESKFICHIITLINRIPFPYNKYSVNIGAYQMVAHSLDRYLALWLWRLRLLEAFETELIRHYCQPGMAAVDIGANIGYYSLLLAQCVGNNGKVWAFEPDPDNYFTLKNNIELNHLHNIKAVNKAIGEKLGKTKLYISPAHKGDHRIYQPQNDHREFIMVDVVSLDEILVSSKRIDLIKIDVQGAEGMVLAGMKSLLSDFQHIKIFMEFSPTEIGQTGFNPKEMLFCLQSLGYRLNRINEKKRELIEIRDIGNFVESISSGKYVNIFINK